MRSLEKKKKPSSSLSQIYWCQDTPTLHKVGTSLRRTVGVGIEAKFRRQYRDCCVYSLTVVSSNDRLASYFKHFINMCGRNLMYDLALITRVGEGSQIKVTGVIVVPFRGYNSCFGTA